MSYLCLDLSTKCSGWSLFSNDGKLKDYGRIEPDKKIPNFFKIHYIVEKIKPLFDDVENLIIEDIFYGKNVKSLIFLGRLSGAVANAWVDYKYTQPLFLNASSARAKVEGLKGNFHKSEIQVFILDKYKFAEKKKIKEYQKMIDDLRESYDKKELKRGQYKYRLDKVSELIDKETQIGEDIADSLVLGLAFKEMNK